MEIFYSNDIRGDVCFLDQEESGHCVRVLRHRSGDHICVIDGEGTFYDCTLLDDSPKAASARIDGVQRCWGAHRYNLTMAVCPTKNIDRFEWFAEKATELGVDVIAPVIGEHSERKVLKTDRIRKILLSATKQSLKGAIPQISEPESVSAFIRAHRDADELKLIAYCFEEEDAPRISIKDVLAEETPAGATPADPAAGQPARPIVILIGPEGDFSRAEASLALECGFRPIHLGESRLRTETAALTAVEAVYFHFM